MRGTNVNDDTKLHLHESGGWENSYFNTKIKLINRYGNELKLSCTRNWGCRYRQIRRLGVYIATVRHCRCRGCAETGAPSSAGRGRRHDVRRAIGAGGGVGVIRQTYSAPHAAAAPLPPYKSHTRTPTSAHTFYTSFPTFQSYECYHLSLWMKQWLFDRSHFRTVWSYESGCRYSLKETRLNSISGVIKSWVNTWANKRSTVL